MWHELVATNLGPAALLVLFAAVFFEDFGLPLPGETVLVTAALMASQGKLPILAVCAVAFLAAVLGDNVGYLIGRSGGHRLLLRKGGVIGLTHARLAKVEHFFHRYGGIIVVLARFFEGLRQLNGIVAGSMMMDWRVFLLFNSIGAALWVGVWGLGVFFFGQKVVHYASLLYEKMNATTIAIGAAVFVLLVALGIWAWRSRNNGNDGNGQA